MGDGKKKSTKTEIIHCILEFFLLSALKIKKEKWREKDKRSVLWKIEAQLPTMAPNVKTPMASGQKKLTIQGLQTQTLFERLKLSATTLF